MKHYLSLVFILTTIFANHAQSDSIFPNLKSYRVDICTHEWDFEWLDNHEYLFIESDDPISDTLRIKHQSGLEVASLLQDGRKTWLKVDSAAANMAIGGQFYPGYGYYPYDEYFLLYDFDVLDTSSIGDTITVGNPSYNILFTIWGIDTVQINNVEKIKYTISTGENGNRIDHLIEGVGGLHPFTPLLGQGFYGVCCCKYDVTYTSETDTLVLSDTMIFGSNAEFCLGSTGLPNLEKAKQIKIYPNPVVGNTFNIKTENNAQIHQVNLYNSQGKKIEIDYNLFKSENHCSVSTNDLSKGFYTVEIVSDSKYYRKKIIIH